MNDNKNTLCISVRSIEYNRCNTPKKFKYEFGFNNSDNNTIFIINTDKEIPFDLIMNVPYDEFMELLKKHTELKTKKIVI